MVQRIPAYETVAASQTGQVLGGGAGQLGDEISHLVIRPATTSPGAVTLLDGATSIVIFPGGADSVTQLIPFCVPLMMNSQVGSWSVTTGANVSVIAVGKFSV